VQRAPRRINEGEEGIVFFADEGGAWQVGVDWPKVLPVYFRCLSSTAAPDEYAQIVNAIGKDFARHDAPKHLSRARGAATREQRAALAPSTATTAERSAAPGFGRARLFFVDREMRILVVEDGSK
jgi:hypothetical protein